MTRTRFIGKTVLITGAGTGMGRAAALRLVAEGAELVLVGRRPEPINRLLGEIEASGGAAIAIAGDIADNEAVAAIVEKTIARFGRLDAVFANAGVLGEFKPLAVTDGDDFDALRDQSQGYLLHDQTVPALPGRRQHSHQRLVDSSRRDAGCWSLCQHEGGVACDDADPGGGARTSQRQDQCHQSRDYSHTHGG